MLLAERLVEGVDVWINTPRRPWEASGTSGMKVLVNGGLNLSVLDGWWAEAYTPDVGWAIGDGAEHGEDPAWDRADAEALYAALEDQIVPEFYNRDANGIPAGWVRRMRESMALLTPTFSANRTVREYTEEQYIPAATAYAVARGEARRRRRGVPRVAQKNCRAVERPSFRRARRGVYEGRSGVCSGGSPGRSESVGCPSGVVCGTAERRRPISSGNGANAPECARSRSLRVLGTDASYPPGSRFYATDHCCSSDGHGPGRKPNDLAEITPAKTYSRAGDKRMNKPRST